MLQNYIYFLIILIFTPVEASKICLNIDGVNQNFKKNITSRLSTIIYNEEIINKGLHDNIFQIKLLKSIKEGLRAFGYYEPNINFKWFIVLSHNKIPILVIYINAGKPIKIINTNINLNGEAKKDLNYQSLIKSSKLKVGTQLNHEDYEKFKNELSNLALSNGYFDAKFQQTQLAVSIKRHEALWNIDYDSGLRYHLGDINFYGSPVDVIYLKNLIPYKKGDIYNSYILAELNRRLSATGWFKSVIINPEIRTASTNKILSLNAFLLPNVENLIKTGIGYSTDVGFRLKGTWEKPLIDNKGRNLTTNTYISPLEQQIDLRYKIPLLESPLEHYYTIASGIKYSNINELKSNSTILTISRNLEDSNWQKQISLHWSFDHFTQGELTTNNVMLIYPSISLKRIHSYGGLIPTWGDEQLYLVDISNPIWGSDVEFLIFQAQNIWIRTLGEKHRFLVRANFGWIETNNFNKIPPTLRFFAGGDHSIRGYKYKNVAQYDRNGHLIGASKLLTGSLEYQYNLKDKWWSAIFIDSGEAVNDLRDNHFKIGTGIGVRWLSPLGPIKFDIVLPIDNKEHCLQFYVGLGLEL
ncbi:autotransporter assembly complex family protein [Pantoea sp. Aalb]|uniref:autotransporter assembly complex protein TamA n=1 Tax=Pantoea sp. Aalb TaxID=2576762 RepID=UPI00132C1763|nr:autotransporter assembly complex family protein [Pantoea sp. Aalb]MXP67688.1 outer membrane protein assembly factor [Pantoea sp. Aalb]